MALVVSLEGDSEDEVVAWATIEQISALTGVPEANISDEAIFRAQAIIDIKTGRTIDMQALLVSENRKRDLYWLRLALAYQTVWMMSQPDMFERMNVTSVSQDGVSAPFLAGALELAPLAKSAINRLSWKGTRSVSVGIAGEDEDAFLSYDAFITDSHREKWEAF